MTLLDKKRHHHVIFAGQLDKEDESQILQAFQTDGFGSSLRIDRHTADSSTPLFPLPPSCDLLLARCLSKECLESYQAALRPEAPTPVILLIEAGQEALAAAALRRGYENILMIAPDGAHLQVLPPLAMNAAHRHRISKKGTKAEAARRELRQHLSEVIKGSPVATFVIDKDHRITDWNRACEEITGIRAEEVVGTSDQWRTFYPEQRLILADLVVDGVADDVMRSYYGDKARPSSIIAGAYEAEDYFPSLERWFFFTAAPLRDSRGRVVGAIETLQDVTQRKVSETALLESERRFRELSITDSLTGLHNSRHFYQQLSLEMTRANRYGSPLSLMLLDVDNFKSYNDTFGHLEGDKVLAVLAGTIRLFLRSTDTAYRFGGEEFTILLPETDLPEGLLVAERLRRVFAEMVFFPAPGRRMQVTISIGVSSCRPGEAYTDFIKRADNGMYRAKQLGRNRVEDGSFLL